MQAANQFRRVLTGSVELTTSLPLAEQQLLFTCGSPDVEKAAAYRRMPWRPNSITRPRRRSPSFYSPLFCRPAHSRRDRAKVGVRQGLPTQARHDSRTGREDETGSDRGRAKRRSPDWYVRPSLDPAPGDIRKFLEDVGGRRPIENWDGHALLTCSRVGSTGPLHLT